MLGAGGVVGEAGVVGDGLAPAGDGEELVPLLVRVGQEADVAVGGLERLAVRIDHPRIAPLADGRLEAVVVEMLDQQEAGHALQHRHLDELALAGARPVQQGRGHGLGHEQAGDLVGHQGRQDTRRGIAVGARQDVGQA